MSAARRRSKRKRNQFSNVSPDLPPGSPHCPRNYPDLPIRENYRILETSRSTYHGVHFSWH